MEKRDSHKCQYCEYWCAKCKEINAAHRGGQHQTGDTLCWCCKHAIPINGNGCEWSRTGCCGCPISYKAVYDLERIKPYEPNVVKAAWNIFGDSYRYRQGYNEFRDRRRAEDKDKAENIGQISFFEVDDET